MPNIGDPDGPDIYSSFTRESEYYGGPGEGNVERHFFCGMHYKGHYKDDQEEGYGELTMSDGSTYAGEWKDGKFHGEGTFTKPSGTSYTGQWVEGRKEGFGTWTLAPNHLGHRVYRGMFVNDQRHGWGLFTVEKPTCGGTAAYEGEWDKDKQTGKGYLLGAEEPGCVDMDGAATLELQRYVDGKKVGEGVRWCDPRKIRLDKEGVPLNEYRDPIGKRVPLPDGGLYYGPWKLKDGRDVGSCTEAEAAVIASTIGLTVNSAFPFVPLGQDPSPA